LPSSPRSDCDPTLMAQVFHTHVAGSVHDGIEAQSVKTLPPVHRPGQRWRSRWLNRRVHKEGDLALVQHGAAGINHIGHIAFALAGTGVRIGSRSRPRTFDGCSRSSRKAPMQYWRIAPTPWLKTSQPALVSMGGPQLPICTSSQGNSGLSSSLRSFQKCALSERIRKMFSLSWREIIA
jgi:hypothetical protein